MERLLKLEQVMAEEVRELEKLSGLTQKRSPNPLKKGAIDFPPFLRGARGDQGLKVSVRKSC